MPRPPFLGVAAAVGRGPSKPLIHFIPSKAVPTKRLRGAAWILTPVCGYRATSFHPQRQVQRIVPISDQEQGNAFLPRFDSAGLLTAVAQDAASGEVLMIAFMDQEALEATRETGLAHFHSRSRGTLWQKGETSGNVLHVEAILVDCDQDALVLKVRPAGPACHTGERSCFYRVVESDGLAAVEA